MANQKFIEAFTEVVREEITNKSDVKLKGVGVFSPQHCKQYQQQQDDGRVVMMPPKDTIAFTPENENGYG